jgi:hypothetical protein
VYGAGGMMRRLDGASINPEALAWTAPEG